MVEKLNILIGGDFSGKTIGVLGLAFKPSTDDIRESSSIEMIQSILGGGGRVKAYDPIANKSMQNIFPDLNYLHSWEETCDDVDAMVIMTEWNEFRGMNLKKLKKVMKTPLVLDTRNILSMDKLSEYGFQFDNVGRKTVL
ncbi:MAG: hypothetical protein HOF58_04630 [Candidatus Marinimicrobia bacterium]|nr:hypothetical protein [Candidatus Neomarinimicrobiota bacterium]